MTIRWLQRTSEIEIKWAPVSLARLIANIPFEIANICPLICNQFSSSQSPLPFGLWAWGRSRANPNQAKLKFYYLLNIHLGLTLRLEVKLELRVEIGASWGSSQAPHRPKLNTGRARHVHGGDPLKDGMSTLSHPPTLTIGKVGTLYQIKCDPLPSVALCWLILLRSHCHAVYRGHKWRKIRFG